MSIIKWRFPSNDYGENKGINDSGVSTFRGTPLKSLAREICQNSLDAARKDTVRIDFNIFSICKEGIPGFDYLNDIFTLCQDFWSSQKATTTKEFFLKAKEEAKNEQLLVLRISDFNTVGLTGTRDEINSNWTNLTKSSGASDKKGTAGGSFGIGKYAPFACSNFSTVFYSTYNVDNEEAYQGVSRLVSFRRKDDGATTQGIGYYGCERNTPVFSQLLLDNKFRRNEEEYGTDIYIIGYKFGEENWQKQIITSVLASYLGAIWHEKLIVNVGDIEISKNTLQEIINIYRDDLYDYTEKYYEVLVSSETHWDEEEVLGLGLIRMGILVGDPDAPRRIAMIRQTGMKIMDKDHLPGHIPFVGIMFIEGDKLNEQLRSIENPEHTQWQPDRAKKPLVAQELLRLLFKYIKDKIDKYTTTGGGEELDAVGVGVFLPDSLDKTDEVSNSEGVSDKVVEVIARIAPKRIIDGDLQGNNKFEDNEIIQEGSVEEGEDDSGWVRKNGKMVKKARTNKKQSHIEEEGNELVPLQKKVSLKKVVPICVDKLNGQYTIKIVPNENCDNATVEVFLSAETQNYAAPIKSVSVIGNTQVSLNGNKINGIVFEKQTTISLKLEIDYQDMCAMEVKAYATSK